MKTLLVHKFFSSVLIIQQKKSNAIAKSYPQAQKIKKFAKNFLPEKKIKIFFPKIIFSKIFSKKFVKK